ncbi:MFS transporter [Streptomyces abyssomicinicus]|uniref:MFS transporter n=1 Tax=Streptomyces abyssomicinicus TaxID=574929 RepID=UPI00124F93F3|nr:MFS transporter [Streptomyces abyssomicinicus]
MPSPLSRLLPDDRLIRAMSYQSVLSAFAEGVFITGEAVYFTQVVGLSPAQVGLMLTLSLAAAFLFSVPLGRLADRLGTRRSWIHGSLLQAVFFASWFLASGFATALAVLIPLVLAETWARTGRNAYRVQIFPREKRVHATAYLRAARNVGYTLGAAAGAVALALDNLTLIHAVPLFTAAVLLSNAYWIARLPEPPRAAPVTPAAPTGPDAGPAAGPAAGPVAGAARRRDPRAALRNRAFVLLTFLNGVLHTHQVLLTTVIPLWLVTETDAPKVVLAWLYGTNTLMAVALQVAAARGVATVADSLRAQRRGAVCFLASCAIIAVTHETAGWVTVLLMWVGHVTVTGAEIYQSAGEWGLVAELADPERRGEYEGVVNLGSNLGTVWAPAAYTFLAMSWGPAGWAVIAAVILTAAVALHPAARACERHLRRHGLTPGDPRELPEPPELPEPRTAGKGTVPEPSLHDHTG